MAATQRGALAPYTPRISVEWDLDAPGTTWQVVDGSLVFVDISGFTALSERLARLGRIGAEELTAVLDTVFGAMLRAAYARGGSLLKFGGDALLLLFESPDHVLQATAAAVEMRAALRISKEIQTSVGRVHLKMSVGVHTGPVDFFLVGDTHRELIVTGPTASDTTEMEGSADAGEIVVSQAVAEALPAGWVGDPKGVGLLLRKRVVHHDPSGPVERKIEDDDSVAAFIPTALRERVASIGGPEHRIASVGFVKFKGVDALLADEGHDATAAALDELVRITQAAIDPEGVTFLASDIDADGGKIILTTGVPASQADDEGRILRAARAILDAGPSLPTRIGINRGHVFAGDVGTDFRRTYTVMGDTVNLAARLMAAASPGQVYASPGVLGQAASLFETEAVPPFFVKGKSEPVQAYEVGAEAGARPPDTGDDLPFGGRDEELASVEAVLEAATTGAGGAVTLVGDTGIGKTRLLAEALERHPETMPVFARGEPTGRDIPYRALRDGLWTWLGIRRGPQPEMVEALRAAVAERAPDLDWATPLLGDLTHIEVPDTDETARIDPRFRPDRAADALAELLAADPESVAIVFDDLHWMDDATAAVAVRLAREADEQPWAVLAAMRASEDAPDPLGTAVQLELLDDDAVRSIVIAATEAAPLRPQDTDALVERAGGNPLFLSELVQVVRQSGDTEHLPDSLEGVVATEIDALPPLSRELLKTVSVLGRSFRPALLEAFLAPEPFELDQATRRDLNRFIEDDGQGRQRFRHAVVHDLAYGSLPYRRRRELHARAAKVLEREAGGHVTPIAGILAMHHAEAGHHERAWELARLAGDRAKAEYANVEAAAQYRRALGAARFVDADPSEVAEAWTDLGEVLELAGRFEEARGAYAKALGLVRDDPVANADLHLRRARTWMPSGGFTNAHRNLTAGRAVLGDLLDDDIRRATARLDSFRAAVHAASGDPMATLEAAERAAEEADAVGELDALARAWTTLDWAIFMTTGSSEGQKGAEAVELLERLGHLERASDAMNNLGAYAYFEGRWDDAVEWYRRGVDTATRAGSPVDAAFIAGNLGELLVNRRQYDEAAPHLEAAERSLLASGMESALPLIRLQRARLALGLGEAERALEIASEATKTAEHDGDRLQAMLLVVEALLRLGRIGDAEEAFGRVAALDPEAREDQAAGIERTRGELLLAAGKAEAATDALQGAATMAGEAGDLLGELLALERLEAVAPSEEGDHRLRSLRSALGVESAGVPIGT